MWTVINQTSKLVLPRERELDMALYATNSKIKTLNKDNISRVLHVNESQRDFIELQKIIQMSIINDTQFEIIFHGSRILQGQDYHLHIEYYKNNTLAPDIQPWTIIVRFAGTGVCYFIIFARWGKTKIFIKFTKQSGHCRLLQD